LLHQAPGLTSRVVILFIGPFLLGVVAIATLAVEHADAVESFPQSCRIRHCPDGWQHPETDFENWMLICQNNPDASYLCFEEQGSVTSDQGYGVSPRYTCWKSCMKGHDASKASDAPNGSDGRTFRRVEPYGKPIYINVRLSHEADQLGGTLRGPLLTKADIHRSTEPPVRPVSLLAA